MGFPASTLTLQKAWEDFQSQALKAKTLSQNLRDESLAGDTARVRYYDLSQSLNDILARWVWLLANTTGLQAYARQQVENDTLDLNAEYITMRNAVTSLRNWIIANIPSDAGSGAALLRLPDGTDIMVTTAQSAGFRTEADAVIASID